MNKTRFVILAIIVGLIFSQLPPILEIQAQDETMIRFYIMPEEDAEGIEGKGPKYLNWRFDPDPPGLDVPYVYMSYGLIPAGLFCVSVTQAQHEQLVANPDVEAAPENIDQNISDIAIPRVQAVMEQLRIPADWVNNTYTYREILRMIAGLFQFAQRHRGLHGEDLIDNQAQLDLRWNQIPQDRRLRILATADDMGYDYSEVENTWLVRQILKHLSDQWGEREFIFFIKDKIDVKL